MSIRNGIENLPQIFPSQAVSAGAPAKSPGNPQSESLAGDRAELSNVATQVSQASQASGATDVRLDKVASIQSALQSGTYDVSAEDVAQKIVASMLASEK